MRKYTIELNGERLLVQFTSAIIAQQFCNQLNENIKSSKKNKEFSIPIYKVVEEEIEVKDNEK